MVATTSSSLTSKSPHMDTDNEQTGARSTLGNSASVGTIVKVDGTLEDPVHVERNIPIRKRRLPMNVLRRAKQTYYCYVYTSAFQNTAEEHND